MIIRSADFVKSSTRLSECPAADYPEYAFAGRSNVGKSSLLNMLAGRKKLARTSAVPGKTRLINHYLINKTWYMVDLPGLGYARVSVNERKKWFAFISSYLTGRKNLLNVFYLVDARIDAQQTDLDFMYQLGRNRIPFAIVFTKTDKLSRSELDRKIENYRRHLLFDWEELPKMFITSSKSKRGRKEILDYISELNDFYFSLQKQQKSGQDLSDKK